MLHIFTFRLSFYLVCILKFCQLCLELEGKDVEDLFTAVLSPSASQPPQLPHPPNTVPTTPVRAVSLHNPGINNLIVSVHKPFTLYYHVCVECSSY